MAEYAHPEVLVDTAWVAEHLNDPNVRIVESNEDILLYDQGHIPGAIKIDWVADLNGQVDPNDYFYIDSTFPRASGSTWALGDFDYNGSDDPNDYFYVDSNFRMTGL